MDKKILILAFSSLLIIIGCSNNHKFNNNYDDDENKIIHDFISSENTEKDKIFSVFVGRSEHSPRVIYISKGYKPMYPINDFTVDSLNGNIVIFQSDEPRKDITYYDEYIQKGYVVIDNMHHEDFIYENYIIVYCPKNKKKRMYTSEEYYDAFEGSEVKFLEDFCD